MARQLAAVARDGPGLRDGLAVHLEERGLTEGRHARLHPSLAVSYDPVLEIHLQF